MIIDCHRHVWAQATDLRNGSLGGAGALPSWANQQNPDLGEAEDAPIRGLVDCSLVLGFKSNLLGVEISNDFLSQYIAQNADCLLGLAGIDPTDRTSPAQAQQLIKDQGFAGVVISPPAQGFHPCDTRAMNLYQKLTELDAPVMFHYPQRWLKAAHLEKASPILLDEVARTFENLRMIISGMGWPYVDQTMLLLAKHHNVFADVSIVVNQPWRVYQVISNAHRYEVMDKLLFGSGWPFCTVRSAVESLYNINEIPRNTGLPSIPREALRAIVERDSLALLGIKHPPGLIAKPDAKRKKVSASD